MVSCLLVTRDRLALVKRALRSFAVQTWPERELVVVTDGTPRFVAAIERHVAGAGIANVRVVVPEGEDLPLGALRNRSLAEARGDYVCQWDDDDYSHPERIERQLAALRGQRAVACLLSDHLHLHEREHAIFWVDWTAGGRPGGIDQLAPGTLLMERGVAARYPESGPHARRGEDSVLLAALAQEGTVARLGGAGHLWLYTYHGRNTFPMEHHRHISAFGAPSAVLRARAGLLRSALAHYPIARPLIVAGPDGPAFALA